MNIKNPNPSVPSISQTESGYYNTSTKEKANFDTWINKITNLAQNIWENPIEYLIIPFIKIFFIILSTILILRIINRLIDHAFSITHIIGAKAVTMRKLFKSIARYTIYFISALTLLANLGLDPLPILASVSFIGLAIGIGAQNLVKDIINGFFIIFEGQLEVNDNVLINNQISGTVEEIGLRITKIREFNQRLHYIANGSITQITNSTREKMRAMVSINILASTNLEVVKKALEEAAEEVKTNFGEWILEKPEVLGVTKVDTNGVQVTIAVLTVPERVWKIECRLREASISALQKYKVYWITQAVRNPEEPPSSTSNTLSIGRANNESPKIKENPNPKPSNLINQESKD